MNFKNIQVYIERIHKGEINYEDIKKLRDEGVINDIEKGELRGEWQLYDRIRAQEDTKKNLERCTELLLTLVELFKSHEGPPQSP